MSIFFFIFLILFSMLSAVRSPVLGSTSAKTTSAPSKVAALAVAKKVIGEVKITLPFFTPKEVYVKCKAAVPELQITEYLASNFFFYIFFKSLYEFSAT